MEQSRTRLAWGLFGLVTVLYGVAIAFSLLSKGLVPEDLVALGFFAFPLVGAPIAARQGRNAVGWVLLGIGLSWGLVEALTGYATYGLRVSRDALPATDVAVAFVSFLWIPAVGLMATFLILLFPDGRPPSPRWRPVAWVSGIAIVVTSLATLFTPGRFVNEGFPRVENPFGLESLEPVVSVAFAIGLVLLLLSIAASVTGLIVRFRRSRGHERLQLKWLTAAGAAVGVSYVVAMSSSFLVLGLTDQDVTAPAPIWVDVAFQIAIGSFLLIPLAVGIAVLRYRLYEIDRLVNRALVYGTLTAFLTTIYLIAVTALQALLRPLAGQSDLAVAASTLAVAALFLPLRGRVQRFIDRRFYRRKYDAVQTVEAFSTRLRDAVELDVLRSDLVRIVEEVMQPSHASLWLRDPNRT